MEKTDDVVLCAQNCWLVFLNLQLLYLPQAGRSSSRSSRVSHTHYGMCETWHATWVFRLGEASSFKLMLIRATSMPGHLETSKAEEGGRVKIDLQERIYLRLKIGREIEYPEGSERERQMTTTMMTIEIGQPPSNPSLANLIGEQEEMVMPRDHNIYTLRISDWSKICDVVGSLTSLAGSSPYLRLVCFSRSWPYTLPFGKTTGSFST